MVELCVHHFVADRSEGHSAACKSQVSPLQIEASSCLLMRDKPSRTWSRKKYKRVHLRLLSRLSLKFLQVQAASAALAARPCGVDLESSTQLTEIERSFS